MFACILLETPPHVNTAPEDEMILSQERRSTKVIGAIFPILRKHVLALLSRDRDVFIKFTKLNLDKDSIIVFYVSRENLLVGEAKVGHVEILDPDEAWFRYRNKLFLNEEEYDRYVAVSPISNRERRMCKVTVFELKNVRKYRNPVRSVYPITPSGRYLTREMIDKIRNRPAR